MWQVVQVTGCLSQSWTDALIHLLLISSVIFIISRATFLCAFASDAMSGTSWQKSHSTPSAFDCPFMTALS